jgi:hypothetical protein
VVKQQAKFYWVAWSDLEIRRRAADLMSFATSFKTVVEWNRSLEETANTKQNKTKQKQQQKQ